MRIDTVTYADFRNIKSATLTLSDGVNILAGNNGAGKTSALEGMHIFAQGRSFRTKRDAELINFGSKCASISMRFSDNKRQNEATYRLDTAKKKRFCRLNGVDVTRLSEFIGAFRAVLFCPADLRLVSDGPLIRRQFIDAALSQLYPAYVSLLQRYNDILSQRNALLRAASERRGDRRVNLDTLEIWSEQLADASAKVAARRDAYVGRLDSVVKELISDMTSGAEQVSLCYERARSFEEYMQMLTCNVEREVRMGTTLFGAHRDDMTITLGGREAKAFSSQGQQRSIAMALKLAEGMLSREETGEYPVFLLDDIFSELDEGRKRYLVRGLEGRQVIITSCDLFPAEGAKIFIVSDGEITEEQ